jgi:hypothetical protein
MIRRAALVALVCAAASLTTDRAEAAERYAVIISGASGTAQHATQHAEWRTTLVSALTERMQIPADRILLLGDVASERQAGQTPAESLQVSTRENVRATFTRLGRTLTREDVLFVILFGHSTFDGVDAKFNLVGPDLEAADWKAVLAPVAARLVFVNTTGASAPFLTRLAGEGRIVMTATDNASQKYETVFPKYFVAAFGETDTDLDKDGRISMWEAFARASTAVKQYYRQRGQLAVEKPVLDDTGDGVGKDAATTGADGALASRTFLDAEDDPARASGPTLSQLISRRNALELEFDELKRRRSFMPGGDYEKQRDQILIDIARVSRQIRSEERKRS